MKLRNIRTVSKPKTKKFIGSGARTENFKYFSSNTQYFRLVRGFLVRIVLNTPSDRQGYEMANWRRIFVEHLGNKMGSETYVFYSHYPIQTRVRIDWGL